MPDAPADRGDRPDTVIVVSQPGRRPLLVVVGGQLDVGRECDGLLVSDERVSRHHLRLQVVDGRLVVADLGSSNGTFLDGVRVRSPTVLDPWSTLTLGSTSIRLRCDPEPEADTRPVARTGTTGRWPPGDDRAPSWLRPNLTTGPGWGDNAPSTHLPAQPKAGAEP